MSLKRYPLDPVQMRGPVLGIEPAMFDGQQSKTRDGIPQWNITCAFKFAGQKPQSDTVKVAQVQEPKFSDYTVVEFEGLTNGLYEVTGRKGISLSATGVRAVASSNGAAPAAPAKSGAAA